MASQRHKLAVHNYGATCYSYEEKQVAIGYIRQAPGPFVQPVGPAGGPLKGSTLSGPPLAVLPGPQIDNPLLLALGLILAAGQQPPEPPAAGFEAWAKTPTPEPDPAEFKAWAEAEPTPPARKTTKKKS